MASLHLESLLGRGASEVRVWFGSQPASVYGVNLSEATLEVAVPAGDSRPSVWVEFVGPGGPLKTNSLTAAVSGAGVDAAIARGQRLQGSLASLSAVDRYRFTAKGRRHHQHRGQPAHELRRA